MGNDSNSAHNSVWKAMRKDLFKTYTKQQGKIANLVERLCMYMYLFKLCAEFWKVK